MYVYTQPMSEMYPREYDFHDLPHHTTPHYIKLYPISSPENMYVLEDGCTGLV